MGWEAILAAAEPERIRLEAALTDPGEQQRALLAALVARNRDCHFGRAHGFDRIRSLDDYRAAVPIRDYEGFRADILDAAAGESAVLTADPLVACEETGGSTSGSKLIPYTSASLASFRAAVLPWLSDLCRRRPQIASGHAYVAVSPAARAPRATAGGIPIGLGSEAAYLGADLLTSFAHILAVGPEVGALQDLDEWRVVTSAGLVACHDLTFVSVWSPTFFERLLSGLRQDPEPVLARLRNDAAATGDSSALRRLERALAGGRFDTHELWPRLDTVSCWADGASAPYARRIGELLPGVHIEPKGLLATEAAVTLPWGSQQGAVPALTSTFVELIGDDSRTYLVDEAEPGASYRVVITTPGGLYRYDLGDRVHCVQRHGGLPRLIFEGRAGVTSDFVGEKLTEPFVAWALNTLPCAAALRPEPSLEHASAAFSGPGHTAHYVLVLDLPTQTPQTEQQLAQTVEKRLATNPQYAYARGLGQLGPLRVEHQPGFFEVATRKAVQAGRRLADIKPGALLVREDPAGQDGRIEPRQVPRQDPPVASRST